MVEARKFLEAPRDRGATTEPQEQRKLSDYEKFWVDLKTENSNDYERHWTPERRKSFLEDGAEFLIDVKDQDIQTMVFMDKSARPLALFLRMLWRRIYSDQEPPEMRFSVGKRDWETEEGADHKFIKQIGREYKKKDFSEENVLFIDEEISSGGTLMETSNLFKQAFPDMRANFGALSTTDFTVANQRLTIQPPKGSYYKTLFEKEYPHNLAQVIHSSKGSHRQTEVEEQSDSMIATAQKMPRKAKWTYRLMLVGKHETLDEKSLQGIDDRIKVAETEEEKARLRKIRQVYEKLLPHE